MSVEMHFVNGHTIVTAFSPRGKWKIRTRPGFAVFFECLADAKTWANKHPVVAETKAAT